MEAYPEIDALHQEHGARLIEVGSMLLPLQYADSPDLEIRRILEKSALIDLRAFELIRVQGPDAMTFLQGMVTNDLKQLSPGGLQHQLLCNNKGKILYHLDVLQMAQEDYILVCDPEEAKLVGNHLYHFLIREDLEMSLMTPHWLRCDLIGPLVFQWLSTQNYHDDHGIWEFQGIQVLTGREQWGTLPRLVCLVPAEDYVRFLKTVLAAHHDIGLAGLEALEQIRIYQGIPRAGVDYNQEHFPQEAGLADHVSYNKGCYLGQEPHARMHYRGHPNRLLVPISWEGTMSLQAGHVLYAGNEEAGLVTSVSQIRNEAGTMRGMAMIRQTLVKEQRPLALIPDGASVICIVAG
ncbi:MAG: hypothetical protein HQM11_15650 [SAR324 cluster bacterium]|nr:hypothetical protein [SAR324 cluster bacterium]